VQVLFLIIALPHAKMMPMQIIIITLTSKRKSWYKIAFTS